MLASLVSAAHLPETALLDLQARHFAVVPSFLTPSTVRAVRADMSRLAEAGKFEEAGVGSGDSNRVAVEQRRCSTCHLYPDEAAAELCGAGDDVARQQLYDAIDSIRDSLSEFDDRPLVKTEGLYLDYPLGGFFKRHIDAAPPGLGLDQEWRRYSYLLYLNDVQRGGELRLYTDESDGFVEVQPRAGTLVVFRSDLVEHEALETRQPRVAVAGWFSRREGGWRAALSRRLGLRSQN